MPKLLSRQVNFAQSYRFIRIQSTFKQLSFKSIFLIACLMGVLPVYAEIDRETLISWVDLKLKGEETTELKAHFDQLKKLDHTEVRIKGFLYSKESEGQTNWILASTPCISSCCLGKSSRALEQMNITFKEGIEPTDIKKSEAVDLIGKLRITLIDRSSEINKENIRLSLHVNSIEREERGALSRLFGL